MLVAVLLAIVGAWIGDRSEFFINLRSHGAVTAAIAGPIDICRSARDPTMARSQLAGRDLKVCMLTGKSPLKVFTGEIFGA